MYSFDARVRYSEVDKDKKLAIASLCKYFQDCAIFHSEDLGVGFDRLEARGELWVLNSWQLVIDRCPDLNEEINVGTWPYGFKGFAGQRNFLMTTKSGERLAYGNTYWAYISFESGRPVVIPPEIRDAYEIEPPYEMEYASRKIPLPEQLEAKESFPVHAMHLDTNLHVNNIAYITMAMEYLPESYDIYQIRAEYKRQARLGDEIFPFVCADNHSYTIALCNADCIPYAVVEFTERNGETC